MNAAECAHCGAPLYEARAFRNPTWAVVIGWVLIPAGLLALGFAGILGMVADEIRDGDLFQRERHAREARTRLEALDRPEWGLVDEFDATGDLSRGTIDALPEPERSEVRAIDRRLEDLELAAKYASDSLAFAKRILLPVALWLGVPALLLGAYLVSWRRAWRCTECGALA